MLTLWGCSQLLVALLIDSPGVRAGMACWAHIGGFVFGAGAATAVSVLGIEHRWIHPRIDAKVNHVVISNRIVDEAMQCHGKGRSTAALRMLFENINDVGPRHDTWIAMWQVAREAKCPERATTVLLRAIDHELKTGEDELAVAHWEELIESNVAFGASARMLVRLGEVLLEKQRTSLAIDSFRRALDSRVEELSVSTLLRIASLTRRLDPALSSRVTKRGLERVDLHHLERLELERITHETVALTANDSD